MNGRSEKEIISGNKMQEKLKELPAIFSEFYYYMYSDKSYTTIEVYIRYVKEFAESVCEGKITEDFYKSVTPLEVNKYFANIKHKKVNGEYQSSGDSIRATKWSALNTFFEFLNENNYVETNPVAKTKRPKVQDTPDVSYLTEEEIQGILKNVRKNASKKMKNRDLAILSLGFATGLRVSALCQINISDIDFDNNTIRVIEKGDKTCDIIFGSHVKRQLKLWLQDREEYFDSKDTDALFLSNFSKRITRYGVYEVIQKYSEGVTDKKVSPHVMRHSCATNLYEKTGDIYLCASVLNHKNISTTQRYAEISKNRKKEAASILNDIVK